MYEELSTEVGVFLFDEFANHLVEQGESVSPARIHGCLTGLLAAGGPVEAEYGLDGVTQTLDVSLHGELAGRVLELYAVTNAALDDDDLGFHPLLPDDDVEIVERTRALAEWCSGFLAGFAHVSAAQERSGEALSKDAGEVLRDIAAIAEAEVDEDEDENDSEESYMELVEYLRFAVLNVVAENRAQ